MKKEEIISTANLLCEQIAMIGFNANLEVNHFFNRIMIYVFDSGSNILLKIDTPFTKSNIRLHKEITDKLIGFINQHKKQSA